MLYQYFVPQSQKLMIKIIDPLSLESWQVHVHCKCCQERDNDVESVSCDGHYIISTDCIVPCTFYCLLDCITTTPLLLLCWDSILWLRFITFSGCWQSRYCKALWEGWSECYAPELLNSSDLHFMIANISSSPDQSRPSTQTSDPASDWSTQSVFSLAKDCWFICWLTCMTPPFQLNPIQLITYPRTFWTEGKNPRLCKTWCNSNNPANILIPHTYKQRVSSL